VAILNFDLRKFFATIRNTYAKLVSAKPLLISGVAGDNLASPSIKSIGLATKGCHFPSKYEKDRCRDYYAR
jgi:hypothetical protein